MYNCVFLCTNIMSSNIAVHGWVEIFKCLLNHLNAIGVFWIKYNFGVLLNQKRTNYPEARRLLAMQRYGKGSLYAALPLDMQRGCLWIHTHDQPVTKVQLYCCTIAHFGWLLIILIKLVLTFYL